MPGVEAAPQLPDSLEEIQGSARLVHLAERFVKAGGMERVGSHRVEADPGDHPEPLAVGSLLDGVLPGEVPGNAEPEVDPLEERLLPGSLQDLKTSASDPEAGLPLRGRCAIRSIASRWRRTSSRAALQVPVERPPGNR
jgi:hypothetical protein